MIVSKEQPYSYILMSSKPDEEFENEVAIANKVQKPKRYKVLLHNDDYSTMEFVIFILEKFFNKTPEEAYTIMMNVHQSGVGVCGIYSKEVAETKSAKVNNYSKSQGHPLKSSFEPCDE